MKIETFLHPGVRIDCTHTDYTGAGRKASREAMRGVKRIKAMAQAGTLQAHIEQLRADLRKGKP